VLDKVEGVLVRETDVEEWAMVKRPTQSAHDCLKEAEVELDC